jgi:hypothetical protein
VCRGNLFSFHLCFCVFRTAGDFLVVVVCYVVVVRASWMSWKTIR